MDRREVLRGLTTGVGVSVSSGAIIAMLASCQKRGDGDESRLNSFFSRDESATIRVLTDAFLPEGAQPGALDVAVPEFIGLLFQEVIREADAKRTRRGLAVFSDRFEREIGAEFLQSESSAQQSYISELFSISNERLREIQSASKHSSSADPDGETGDLYAALTLLRELTIMCYVFSEQIGEQVLGYDPIPGDYSGCISASDINATWSLR